MSKFLYFVAFVVGAGVGVAASQQYFRSKYAEKAENDVKEALSRFQKAEDHENKEEVCVPEVKIPDEKPNIMDFYKEKVEEYTDYNSAPENPDNRMEKILKEEPYLIRPEEVNTVGYRVISLTLFDDDVLTDDNFDPLDYDEIVTCVGDDFKEHFGTYEHDAVHIRNDALKIDYEILKDFRKYAEVAKFKPGSEG